MLQEQISTEENVNDRNHPVFNLVAFFIPILGALIYFANLEAYPIRAKGIGRSTLWGFAYMGVYLLFKLAFAR